MNTAKKNEYRRFLPIGTSDEMEQLDALLEKKGMNREELILIFRCLKINPACKDIFE